MHAHRLDAYKIAPAGMAALRGVEAYLHQSTLGPRLIELVKMRASLAWTDALTLIAETQAPDTVYDEVRRHFDDKELVDLTTLIGMINLWNRLAISLRYEHPVSAAA